MAGVDLAYGAAIWAGVVRVLVSSLLWYGIGGEEQRGPQADEPDHGQGGHRQRVGSVPGGQVGHQDGAGDGGAKRRAQVGDTARQPRDLPLLFLGEGRLHQVDRRGQHDAHAQADQQQPGHEGQDAVGGADQADQQADADDGGDKTGQDQALLRASAGESLGPQGGDQDADRRRGEDDAGLDGVVAANGLEVDRDDERGPQQHQPLDVLGDKTEVGGAVAEQPGGQQRFFPGPLQGANPEEEPEQQGGSQGQEDRHQQAVAAGLEDPEDHEQHAEGRKDRPDGVEGAGRIRRQGIHELAAEQDDRGDDQGLEQERGSPADRRGDEAPDQRAGGGADAAHPADPAERPGARPQIGEKKRGEDIDGRDQQGRADAFQDRVAEDEDAEAGGNCAQQSADAVDGEAHGEAALTAPGVRQLAARDHQGRHDQQEQRDRGLHPLDGGVQVGADVVDHHVHVGTGEAADELGKSEGNQQPPRGDGR